MILGNGVDIVKVSRIENLLKNKKDGFLHKVFTQNEIEYIKNTGCNPQTISGIFAAKEALSKLLGTGIGKVNWKDMEVFHDERGKPYVKLYNEGLNISQNLGIENIELSISHEKEYAIAFVIGEGKSEKVDVKVPDDIKNILPMREKDSHKGTFGRVGIIAGSKGMAGAAYLATMAALRSGSGLVYAIIPNSLNEILSIKLTEAIIKSVEDEDAGHFNLYSFDGLKEIIDDMDVLALGPGIGVDEIRIELVNKILSTYEKPIVLDADGINCISKGNPDILSNRKAETVITPHPGELSRLLRLDIDTIQKKRFEYSKMISNKYNVITVLKGANTLVTNPKGDIYINFSGNPGMATAGSGDLLTGIIASFIGQGITSYEAAVLGVYCHGIAGDLAKMDKGEYGMISRDILDNIPYSIKRLEW
ncbi:ADP-dependent (S)-NAD(P)H-hydrate dehydratase [[Clostridium] ultunense Esp]|uniref:Multifunctional fusion protein n=1 Tax=[Clostridium] ultunense Esp TaxID=1288971 RepID=M1ZL94_9FIRM|nr:NAD(P)H-hydrate dehydratase [Schnuerera ultunensis]CCQ96807.1 ADP-dependent (S)-NAD(P)H-hydrate dehydratase [[Clostridium] ultunense Esp]SHD75571.1 ADP-dependent (S)-NAD(P)H-hydrate dehydratase [[Clostridium] ultunense Esp]